LKNHSITLISKNALSLSIGQGLSFVLNFFSIAIAARDLGVNNFGTFSSLLAISMIISKVIDFGFTPIVFRETAKSGKLDYINSAILLRVISFFAVTVVFNVLAYLLHFPTIEIVLSDILLLNIIISSKFNNIRELLEVPFKSELQMHYPMLFNVIDNLILLLLVILIPYIKAGVLYFTFAYLVSNIPGFFFMGITLKRRYKYSIKFDIKNFRWLIKESMPIYGFVVCTTIYQQIDYLMIRYLDSNFSVGIFSVATRLTMPLYIIPAVIASSILPVIIRNMHDTDSANLKIYRFVYKLLFLISFSIATLISLKVNSIVSLVFGNEYLNSASSTVLLAWTQVFVFHSYFTMEILIAHNRQKYNFYYSLVLVLSNLILNFLLIPKFSYIGASVAKLTACFIGFLFLVWMLNKIKIDFGMDKIKMIIWGLFNTSFIYIFSFLPLFPFLFVASIIIIIVTYFSGYFDEDEMVLIFKLLHKEDLGNKIISKLKYNAKVY
jgi:O-antigen/teichoic acid export membrane protein